MVKWAKAVSIQAHINWGCTKQKFEQIICGAVSMQAVKGGKLGEDREHAGAYKVGVNKQKLEQMIVGAVSMQAAYMW